VTEDDRREIYFARLLLEQPRKSCGYSGDALLEIDENSVKGAKD
jgi:hypothetical protein